MCKAELQAQSRAGPVLVCPGHGRGWEGQCAWAMAPSPTPHPPASEDREETAWLVCTWGPNRAGRQRVGRTGEEGTPNRTGVQPCQGGVLAVSGGDSRGGARVPRDETGRRSCVHARAPRQPGRAAGHEASSQAPPSSVSTPACGLPKFFLLPFGALVTLHATVAPTGTATVRTGAAANTRTHNPPVLTTNHRVSHVWERRR